MRYPEVTVIDYGVGNLLSVKRGLEQSGSKVLITSDPRKILDSQRLVLPGVGAFPNAMSALKELNLVSVLQDFSLLNRPLLAICLGMQLLMDESEEFGLTFGLGIIPGRVIAVPATSINGELQKIPHIGWNSLHFSKQRGNWSGSLLESNHEGDAAYFVHSFMVEPKQEANRIADSIYGGHAVSAVIANDLITGCQFHPEKSGEVGLKILRKFIRQ